MATSDDRLLSFFVSGALVVGSAACSKDKGSDRPTSNQGPHKDHVNEGPAPVNASDAGLTVKEPTVETRTNVGREKNPASEHEENAPVEPKPE